MKELKGFKKGINFGGWFSQCDYSKERFDNFIKEEDFKKVSEWGMDHVRIPVDYNLVLNDDYSYKEDGFIRLENAINLCKKYHLNMILDLHKTVGFSFDPNEKEDNFFFNEDYQNIFYNLWIEFTKRFSKYEDMLAFELLNEVTSFEYKDAWNSIASKCIKNIRDISSNIKILVGGYYNNSAESVKDIDVPFDENIVLNFHCYEPLVFTHQGAYWIDKMNKDFRFSYKSTFKQVNEETKYNIGIDNLDYSFMNENEYIGPSFFEKLFKQSIDFAEAHNCYLYCGEYGVIEHALVSDIKSWYLDIHSIFDKYNIGHALWSYKEMDFDFVNSRFDEIRKEVIG